MSLKVGGGQFENLFFIVRNKEIFSHEGGGQSQKVLIFVPIYIGLIKGFLSESSLNLHIKGLALQNDAPKKKIKGRFT